MIEEILLVWAEKFPVTFKLKDARSHIIKNHYLNYREAGSGTDLNQAALCVSLADRFIIKFRNF